MALAFSHIIKVLKIFSVTHKKIGHRTEPKGVRIMIINVKPYLQTPCGEVKVLMILTHIKKPSTLPYFFVVSHSTVFDAFRRGEK